MIVTEKQFFMEKRLVEKLDLMIKRLKGTDDSVIICDGDEGQGKTNLLMGICYYVSQQTGRQYNVNNIFFSLDDLIKFASETKEQIIHWDEGALGGLTTEWWKKNQIKFITLLMVARKKKHFIAIAIPKFKKLTEYIIVDRSLALIHVYSRRQIEKGRFIYYTKKKKELLYNDWKRSRIAKYSKYKSFGGSFLEYGKKVFNQEQLDEYEAKKDAAILSIGEVSERVSKTEKRYIQMRYNLWRFTKETSKVSQEDLAKFLGISAKTISAWQDLPEKHPFLKDN